MKECEIIFSSSIRLKGKIWENYSQSHGTLIKNYLLLFLSRLIHIIYYSVYSGKVVCGIEINILHLRVEFGDSWCCAFLFTGVFWETDFNLCAGVAGIGVIALTPSVCVAWTFWARFTFSWEIKHKIIFIDLQLIMIIRFIRLG